MVVHREGRGRGIHNGKVLRQNLFIGDGIILDGIGIFGGVGVVNAVDVFGKQDHIGIDLRRAKNCRRVGREKRRTDAAAEEHHAALLEVPDRAGADIGLGNFFDLKRRLHAHINALLLQNVRNRHAVHRGGQHTHVVGTGALNVTFAILHAAPEVAAADDDAHFNAHLAALLDYVAHLGNNIKVETKMLVACQRLAADLEQHALILQLSHARNLPFQEFTI